MRSTNRNAPALALVQPQEETKEEFERNSLLEERKEEIHVPGEKKLKKLLKKKERKYIHLWKIQRKKL